MVRKTREQVWRELDELGENEVRLRLAGHPAGAEEPPLVQEWLTRRELVASELADTSSKLASRSAETRVAGKLALFGLAALAVGFLLARRGR